MQSFSTNGADKLLPADTEAGERTTAQVLGLGRRNIVDRVSPTATATVDEDGGGGSSSSAPLHIPFSPEDTPVSNRGLLVAGETGPRCVVAAPNA